MYTTNARKHSGSSDYGCGAYLLVFAVLLGIYMMLFFWYANTAIARTYPTPYTNAFWGWLHGTFAIPSFIVSLFNDDVAIYQSPNSGGWYNFGYLVGVGAFFGSAKRSARKK